MTEYYAHSIDGRPVSEWHLLEEHLKETAELAAKFAAEFGSGERAYPAGLWHVLKSRFVGEAGKVFIFLFVQLKPDTVDYDF